MYQLIFIWPSRAFIGHSEDLIKAFMNLAHLWDQLVDCICRPPRDNYAKVDLLGGERAVIRLHGKEYLRKDIRLTNKLGQRLECSHTVPKKPPSFAPDGVLPCVVYCHCNSGSRRDAEEALHLLLPHNITVFYLDFAGSGWSEGDYVTLGKREQDDLEVAIQYLRSSGTVTTIGLWGRSMGAVTAILYAHKDPSMACLVVDSPFSRLTDLMLELVEEQKIPIPRYLMKVALSMMRRSVRKRAKFNIDDVAPLAVVPQLQIPILYGHATGDTFVKPAHSQKLFEATGTEKPDKTLELFPGDHNSGRSRDFYTKVLGLFHSALQCQGVLVPDEHHPGRFEILFTDPRPGSRAPQAAVRTQSLAPPGRPTSPPWNRPDSFTGTAESVVEQLDDERARNLQQGETSDSSSHTSQRARREQGRQSGAPSSCSVRASSRMHEDGMTQEELERDQRMLAAALESSLRDAQQQERQPAQNVAAADAAAQDMKAVPCGQGPAPVELWGPEAVDFVPADMQHMTAESFNEAAMEAAIQASLREALPAEPAHPPVDSFGHGRPQQEPQQPQGRPQRPHDLPPSSLPPQEPLLHPQAGNSPQHQGGGTQDPIQQPPAPYQSGDKAPTWACAGGSSTSSSSSERQGERPGVGAPQASQPRAASRASSAAGWSTPGGSAYPSARQHVPPAPDGPSTSSERCGFPEQFLPASANQGKRVAEPVSSSLPQLGSGGQEGSDSSGAAPASSDHPPLPLLTREQKMAQLREQAAKQAAKQAAGRR